MDSFKVSRPVHSHLSYLSISIGTGKTPSSSAAAPHRSAENWPIWQPGSLIIFLALLQRGIANQQMVTIQFLLAMSCFLIILSELMWKLYLFLLFALHHH